MGEYLTKRLSAAFPTFSMPPLPKQNNLITLLGKGRSDGTDIHGELPRRHITNLVALERHLQVTFPSYETEIVYPLELSVAEQYHLMKRTKILISPCGGVSFIGWFLPSNSAAVFI